jgi:hypothetical protein
MVVKYHITKITNGVARVEYEGGTWAEVPLEPTMTVDQVDAVILAFGPKTHAVPDFITVGYSRTVTPPAKEEPTIPDLSSPDNTMAWFQARAAAYGPVEAQIEYITENGLEAWQAYVAQVKANNPKS